MRLTSVERLEREMFGFPSPAVEITEFNEPPASRSAG